MPVPLSKPQFQPGPLRLEEREELFFWVTGPPGHAWPCRSQSHDWFEVNEQTP